MSNLTRWTSVVLALSGLTAFGCSHDGAATATETPVVESTNDLADSASALRANDSDATFEALDRCDRRGRKDDSDAGVDEDRGRNRDRDRGDRGNTAGRGGRDDNRGRGNGDIASAIARGLDSLLAVADLDALKECQEIAKTCAAMDDRSSCRTDVENCVRPVLTDAFKALCEERTAACEKDSDADGCKAVERACSADLTGAATGSTGATGTRGPGRSKP